MSIREPHTKAPRTPLPAGYRPVGSLPHKVSDGESWATLARARKVDVLWLIQYNFETRDPYEINWYLKNWTGCRKTTRDGKNFLFSSGDSPGVVFLPTEETAHRLKSLAFNVYGITIEGDDDYRQAVKPVLERIAMSDTGMILLKRIRQTGRPITISAWTGVACNATATANDIRQATHANEIVLKGRGSFKQVMEPSLIRDLLGLPHDPVVGTGGGSGAVVNFTPSMFGFGAKGACAPYAGTPGASPSQVLFHELAHAYRFARGKFHPRPTIGGSVGYTDMEEFFAVVLSNVLTADPSYSTGNRTLRADHSGFVPLAPDLSTSKAFVTNFPNRNKMRELIADEPELANALHDVKSSFNPFAEPL